MNYELIFWAAEAVLLALMYLLGYRHGRGKSIQFKPPKRPNFYTTDHRTQELKDDQPMRPDLEDSDE